MRVCDLILMSIANGSRESAPDDRLRDASRKMRLKTRRSSQIGRHLGFTGPEGGENLLTGWPGSRAPGLLRGTAPDWSAAMISRAGWTSIVTPLARIRA